MKRPWPITPITVGLVLAALFLSSVAGCMPRRPRNPKSKPAKLEPIEIDWNDPGTVVEGFFDAKKRGDWRKAFSCCDFEERLGAEEAKKIRDQWKSEASTWPDAYSRSQWFILDMTISGDYALVSVVHIRYVGPGTRDDERTTFDELCKRYSDRWKITEFELPPDRRSQ
jgi:hypothetical protein